VRGRGSAALTTEELIAGTERCGELPPEDDPSDGPVESETEAGGEPVSA
jgi:hypothetical protein